MKTDEEREGEIEGEIEPSEPSEAGEGADKRAYAMRYISALTAKARATRFLEIDKNKISKADRTIKNLRALLGEDEVEKIEKVYKDFLENLR